MPIRDTSYLFIKSDSKGDFYSEWQDCKEQLTSLIKKGRSRIFKINIFVNPTEIDSFREKKQFLKESLFNIFGEMCPTFGILAQSPEKPFNLVIEIGLIHSSDFKVEYRKYKDHQYTVIENGNYKELWANGIEDTNAVPDTEASSRNAFDLVHQILSVENMSFDHIVRQWNYIGNILSSDEKKQLSIQHYQIFNDVRHSYYSRYRSIADFPAATGIGVNFNRFSIDFCAILPNDDTLIASVNNPNQINPYSYEQKVLIDSQTDGKEEKTPPHFERAKLILHHDKSQLFVSGTASIIGQETVGKNDVELQTRITIENIEALVARKNLLLYCPYLKGKTPGKYLYVRVYVKHNADMSMVKSICVKHFGNIPVNYVQADICRDDLLVEIEAELCS